MSSRLAGFPTGLLDLVGSQNFGIAPKELLETVSPTVDMLELYSLTKQSGRISILSAPANGNNAGQGLVVPAGEVWRIVAGGIFVAAGVGVTGDFTPIVNSGGGTTPLGDTLSVAASTTRWITSKAGSAFWLRSGDELGAYITALAGAPTVSVAYQVARFRA